MPVINFKYSDLRTMLGDVPQETLVERIPMIGADMGDTAEGTDEMSVEFFPDRPDLYSVEGVARGMRAFLDIEPGMKTYDVGSYDADVYIDGSVKDVRPYFLCGVVLGVDIDDNMLRSIMEMQEKLHITIGRKRSKLAIGIHDLDKVTPPFTYKAVDPHSIRFVPLAKTEEMDMEEILAKHEKGRDYAHLLEGFDRYPIILDANGEVLSFPPIINGALTTVTTSTKNLFIDVTGYDRKAVKGALDIVATSLAERGGRIMTVRMHDGPINFTSPDLSPTEISISSKECDRFLGISLGPQGAVDCLRRMGMDATANGDTIRVRYPCTRLDIMHKVDIFEDVATGYGFDRFGGPYKLEQTAGGLDQITTFSDGIRDVLLGLGFTEVTTLTLSNQRDEFELSGLPEVDTVRVLNPITEDHTCLRAYLMPSLVRILRHNKHRGLPQRIFEVGNVIRDTKVVPHLCAMETAAATSFTSIKSITESVLRELGVDYTLEACDLPTFVAGRGAYVVSGGRRIGIFGEVAPSVVVGYEITHPIIFMELDLATILSERKDTLFRGDSMDKGDRFPAFVLQDENGEEFDSRQLEGIRYVIYFYPKDNTPGCTTEAKDFTDAFPNFMMRNIPVIGVSKDSVKSHRNFADKHQLKVKLLSDPEHTLMEQVGAWGTKVSYGKETVGTIRSTFIVGKDGTVEYAWRNVKVAGHVQKVLDMAVKLAKSRSLEQLPQDLLGIAYQAEVRIAVDGGVPVRVHGYDPLGVPAAGHMLHAAGYAHGDVQVRGYGASGQSDLARPRHEAPVGEGPGAGHLGAHPLGHLVGHLHGLGIADASAEGYQDPGF